MLYYNISDKLFDVEKLLYFSTLFIKNYIDPFFFIYKTYKKKTLMYKCNY